MSATSDAKLRDTISSALDNVLDKHRAEISQLTGKSGGLTRSVLENEAVMRSIAEYAYAALPWPVRMAVKQPVFVEYVMSHREGIAEKLMRGQRSTGQPA